MSKKLLFFQIIAHLEHNFIILFSTIWLFIYLADIYLKGVHITFNCNPFPCISVIDKSLPPVNDFKNLFVI